MPFHLCDMHLLFPRNVDGESSRRELCTTHSQGDLSVVANNIVYGLITEPIVGFPYTVGR